MTRSMSSLLKAVGKGIVKSGYYQSYELFVLLYDDAFGYVRQVVQLIFYFFGVDVLSAWAEEHILAASFDGDIAFGIHQARSPVCSQPSLSTTSAVASSFL